MRELLLKTGRHGLAFSTSLLLSRMVGFVLVPFLTKELPKADFGVVDSLALAGQVIALVAAQGIPPAVFRAYSYTAASAAERRAAIVTGFRYTGLSTLVLGLTCALFAAPLAGALGGDRSFAPLFLMVLATYWCSNVRNVCAAVLRAEFRTKEFLTVHCGEFLLCVALNVYFVLILKTGLCGIIYSNLIGAVAALVLAVCFVPQVLGAAFDRRLLREMLVFGLPLVPGSLALWLLDFTDRFCFLWLLPQREALDLIGLYGRGVLFASILQAVLIMPLTSLWPNVFYDLAKSEHGHRNIGRCASYYAAVSCFLGVGLGAVSRPIVALMTAPEYHKAWVVVPVLSFGIVLLGASKVTEVGFYISGRTRRLPFLVFGAVLANAALNLALIPRFGISGAAWASACAYAVLVVIMGGCGARHYRIDYEWRRLLKTALVAALVLAACLLLPYPGDASAGRVLADLLLRGTLAALLFPALLLAVGFLDAEERQILRQALHRC
ncbi:MAG: lipopolysaccharide biosynthesis protein [Planctomycetes bacterium]|nr:lipopolysaccharide biosynthesis protein [Planctomycetota bacterium]